MRYSFQNPRDGWPMILREVEYGNLAVNPKELDIDPEFSTLEDSREMSKAIRYCKNIHDAAEYLRREYDAKDIFD